jgi:Family of unknown function (DUF6338)
MPATIEALLIVFVFVMPGFIAVRTKEMLVPSVGKPEALQITLRSITASLLYLPLWLLSAGGLLLLRRHLLQLSALPVAVPPPLSRSVIVFFMLTAVLPISIGVLWAIGSWNDWYPHLAEITHPRLGLRPPSRGVGEDLWDKLWLNRIRQPWLTVYMKDGRVYIGRGIEFSQSTYGRDLVLGPDTKIFKDGEQTKDLATSDGEAVWIPGGEIVSIDIHQ